MRRAAVMLALPALALSACGAAQPNSADKFTGDRAQVAEVVDQLATAGAKGDAQAICDDILAKQLVTELKNAGGDCVTEMKHAIQDASDYDLQVKDVKVTGSTATAQVRQGETGKLATFSFVKEGGEWRASALGS